MRALPRGALRIAGPVACLVLLLYGVVSLSRPHHGYVLSFSLAGETKGALQAGIRLDDGLLVAPAVAFSEDKSIHMVALPTRTIRAVRLFVGERSAGTIRDLHVVRVRGEPSPSVLSDARSLYRKIDLNAGLTTQGVRVEHKDADTLTFQSEAAAGNPFLQLD